jgi:hypothetical protein
MCDMIIDMVLSRLRTAILAGIHAMDPFLLQWRLYINNIRNANLWSIKYNVYADQHRHVTKKTTDSSYVYYDCRGATVGYRGSMALIPAYIAVGNLLIMKSMDMIH